eukprot:7381469-Prymnesium_polylepis.1
MHLAHLGLEQTAQVAPAQALTAGAELVARQQLSILEDLWSGMQTDEGVMLRGALKELAAVCVRHDRLGEAIGVHVAVEDSAYRLPPALIRLR